VNILKTLSCDSLRGLSTQEVAERQIVYGKNHLVQKGARSPLAILWDQLASMLVGILAFAVFVSLLLGDYKDAIAILAILVVNSGLGFLQDYKAERAIAALQKMAQPMARVRRNGLVTEVPLIEIVPGDIVFLEAGYIVPADCRILECAELQIQEAALTGESIPVYKTSIPIEEQDVPLSERNNMAFLGTVASNGRGTAVVIATGSATELGRVASLIQAIAHEPTTLQRSLNQLGKKLAYTTLGVVMVIVLAELIRGTELKLLLLTAISLAVAAIPEGLPAVVTIALALGAQRMLHQKALIRKLSAVETLGGVTVICSDKTGTLTQNQIVTAVLQLPERKISLMDGDKDLQDLPDDARRLLACGLLCNDASISPKAPVGSTPETSEHIVGDPTEVALLRSAVQAGLSRSLFADLCPRVSEIPFSSERRLMTTIHQMQPESASQLLQVSALFANTPSSALVVTKGSAERVLEISQSIALGDHITPLTSEWRQRIIQAQNELAGGGMRVLGFAYRRPREIPLAAESESEMTFIGLVGMIDPPRPEVKEAVRICTEAGIRPVMITGDHPLTALSIASELGIGSDSKVLTGKDLDRLSTQELLAAIGNVSVYARVSPEHKLRLVEALQSQNQIVAMTGDGVNDAPALKKANIGVAMGKGGTDVAKESADIILLDDNFATIVCAVKEGRVIHDNIRKFIKYLMTTNSAEVIVMFLAPFLGMPLPLLPLQILWLNLISDGPSALALGVEPAEPHVMRKPPRSPGQSMVDSSMARHIAWVGMLMGLVSLGIGYWYWKLDSEYWQTMVFLTLILSQLAHVLVIRSGSETFFRFDLPSNKYLFWAVGVTLLLQFAALYFPLLQKTLHTKPLPPGDIAISMLGAAIIFFAVEAEKLVARKRLAVGSPFR